MGKYTKVTQTIKPGDGVVLPFECVNGEDYCPPGPVTTRQMTPEEREKYGPPQNRPIPAHLANLRRLCKQGGSKMVEFRVPEGADWQEVLTPEIYLKLKQAGWSDKRIREACGIANYPNALTRWKKEHGLGDVKLRIDGAVPEKVREMEPPASAGESVAGVKDELQGSPGEGIQEPVPVEIAGEKVMLPPCRPPVEVPADPGPEAPERKLPGANLPEGPRSWSDVITWEQMASVSHLGNREAAETLGMPFYAYRALKTQYGLAHSSTSAGRKVLTVTEAAIEAGKLREDLECCRRLLSEAEGLSGGVVLALEQLANSAQRKLDAIDRVKVVI